MIYEELYAVLPPLINRLSVMCVAGLWLLPLQSAIAHPELMTSVRHRASIHAGRKNVDVSIELTIGEIPSFAERLQMDANQDGRIEGSEVEGYLSERLEVLQQAVSLSIDGQPVELLFLYEPEIDLEGEDTSSASHLIFRLFYFARTPSGMKAGDEIVLEDRLWPHAPSLGSYQVAGQDGVELVAEKTTSTLWSGPRDETPLVMRARFHAVPSHDSRHKRSGRAKPSEVGVAITETRLPANTNRPIEASELKEAVRVRTNLPLQELSTTRLPAAGLFAIAAAAVLIASAATVIGRRTHRTRKETLP